MARRCYRLPIPLFLPPASGKIHIATTKKHSGERFEFVEGGIGNAQANRATGRRRTLYSR
jgi:hypothetical protein